MASVLFTLESMDSRWIHSKTIVDSEPFAIEGVNIWDHPWENTGESIAIKDPLYNQDYRFTVYKIATSGKSILFAAGEFSNCVWGIYEKKNN